MISKNYIGKACIFVSVLLFLFVSGMPFLWPWLRFVALTITLVPLLIAFVFKRKIVLPSHFILYLTFLLAFAISLLWSQEISVSLDFFIAFAVGGAMWISSYNFKEDLKENLNIIIIALGILFTLLYFFHRYLFNSENTFNLYSQYSSNHLLIGDLWAIVLLVILPSLIKKLKLWQLPMLAVGLYFLIISLSRSAYLSLFVGTYVLFRNSGWLVPYKKIFYSIGTVLIAIFLYSAFFKTTLYSRLPYFAEAIFGFFKYPFGVGVGNFQIISQEFYNKVGGPAFLTSSPHDLVLEITSGIGFLTIFFVIWLTKVCYDVAKNSSAQSALFAALFFALLANFLFNVTYTIPTMLWLWFMSLGLAQEKK